MVFFETISYLNLMFLSLLGIGFFSTSISEEREEDTLGLMLMAGVSPLAILAGKSAGRLIQALFLVAVQFPLTLLAVTLGGITTSQIASAYLGLTSYLILLAGFGLLCSTVARNNRVATMWMTIGLICYVFVPMIAAGLLSSQPQISGGRLLDYVVRLSVFQQMGTILTSGFGESLISLQVISNASAGIACSLLSWAVFGYFSQNPSTESTTRGFLPSQGTLALLAPCRAWSNPFLWKDFYFVSGGIVWLVIRTILCLAIYVLALIYVKAIGLDLLIANTEISAFQVFLALGISVEAARMISRSMNDEIRGQTLSALLMLPRHPAYVIYSKLAGALFGILPMVIVSLLIIMTTSRGAENFFVMARLDAIFLPLTMFVFPSYFAIILAVYFRWGAVPLGFAMSIAFHVFVDTVIVLAAFQAVVPALSLFLFFAAPLSVHFALLSRIRKLGESG